MARLIILTEHEEKIAEYRQWAHNWAHEAFFARNEIDVSTIIKNERPALIIIDRPSLQQENLELCRQLKENSDNASVLTVLALDMNDEDMRKHAFEVECNSIIGQPMDEEELHLVVEKLLRSEEHYYLNSRTKMITGLTDLLESLVTETEAESDAYARLNIYAQNLLVSDRHKLKAKKLYLACFRYSFIHLMYSKRYGINKKLEDNLHSSVETEWIYQGTIYIKLQLKQPNLTPEEQAQLQAAKDYLEQLRIMEMAQLIILLLSYYELTQEYADKRTVLKELEKQAKCRDFSSQHLFQLQQILMAEDIFADM